MTYYVGLDIGTTYSAAAVWRDGQAEVTALGTRATVVPSVLFRRDDGEMLVGEAAERREATQPERAAREFKRRFGDPKALLVGGTPFSAEALTARLLRWIVDTVAEREGKPAAGIVVSHPANWGPYKLDLLEQAIHLADLDADSAVSLVSEPEAAAIHYASQERVESGATVAVYDLGGGSFDVALLRHRDGWEFLGRPDGVEHLGGVDLDQAVFGHVEECLGKPLLDIHGAGLTRLRRDCVEAKEVLSSDVDCAIPVMLPGLQTEVRLTRAEFEEMIRPTLAPTIDALRRTLRSASVSADDLATVLLVGGSSRVPLVAQLVSCELRRPVAIDAHPKHGVALGASILAADRAPRSTHQPPPTPQPVLALDMGAPVPISRARTGGLKVAAAAAVTVLAGFGVVAASTGGGEEPSGGPTPTTSEAAEAPATTTTSDAPTTTSSEAPTTTTESPTTTTETTPPAPEPDTTTVEVSATEPLTDSGLDIAAGDTVLITASGEIRDDINNFPDRYFPPEGEPDPDGLHSGDPYYQTFDHAALLASLGEYGEPIAVGREREWTAEDSGRLYFSINDSGFYDNDGSFSVEVTVTRAG